MCITALAVAHEPELVAPSVEVRGHYDSGIGTSDAASGGSVTGRLIQTRPALRPGEVLEFVPGVIVTQHSGDGKANQYFVRGFNLDHGTDFAVNVAGMPVNMPTHAHGQGYTDLSFLIPELISRIDFRKGPYYAETGDFASAGAVSIRYADKLPSNSLTATLGSFDYRRAVLTGSPTLGPGNLVYGFEAVGNNGPWDQPAGYRKLNGVLKYVHGDAADGFNVALMAYDGKWDATDQIPSRAVERGELSRFGAVDTTSGGKTYRYSLSGSRYGEFAKGRYDIDAYAIRYGLNLFSNFTYFLNDPVNGDQFEQADRRTIYGLHPRITLPTTIGGFDVINRIGLQGRFDDIDQVGLFNTVSRQRLSTVRDDKVQQQSVGIYAESAIQWHEKFRTVAGLRGDWYRFDVNSSLAVNSGKARDQIVSPKLNMIFGPWAKTEYFVNWGQGFHSNDARGTVINVDPNSPSDPVQRVTPLVRSRGYEVGVRTEIIPNLQSSLALWRLKLDSELLFIGDAGTTVASRASERTGIEWINHYVGPRDWIFDAQIAASRAKFRDEDPAGNRIPGSINRVASFGITWDPKERWFGGVQYRYFGPRPLIEDGSVQSRSTSLLYFRAGYRFSHHWTVRLDAFNVFNRKQSDIDYYYPSCLRSEAGDSRCDPGAASRDGINDIHFHPVERRSIRLSVIANF